MTFPFWGFNWVVLNYNQNTWDMKMRSPDTLHHVGTYGTTPLYWHLASTGMRDIENSVNCMLSFAPVPRVTWITKISVVLM